MPFDSLQNGGFSIQINKSLHILYNEKQRRRDIVLPKYQDEDTSTKVLIDLNGGVGLAKIKRWCQMLRQYGSIKLSDPSGRPRIVRTIENIRKVKNRLRRPGLVVSARKLSVELEISERSVRRILKVDLGLCPYQKIIEPALSNDQRIKRIQFPNWAQIT